jgi:prevent-host-death family protein
MARSTGATAPPMAEHPITQRELRNDSGEIMRALDRGEAFVVTRNGVPVGRLLPVEQRDFVATGALLDAAASLPPIDAQRFRAEVDAWLDQDAEPRA